MSFVNPFFLYLLPLTAAPLLIHLLGKQRYKKVAFSSLRFLKVLELDVVRRLKLRQIILLILRTLLIFFLIMTFARPYRSKVAAGTFVRQGETLYLIVDNSVSMRSTHQGQDRLQTGLERVRQLTNQIEFPIILKIMHATQPDSIIDRGLIRNLEQFNQALEAIEAGYFTAALDRALHRVDQDISERQTLSAVVWLISDFQKSNWSLRPHPEHPVEQLLRRERVTMLWLPIAHQNPNAALGNLHFPDQLLEKDKPVHIEALVHNWKKARDLPVSLLLENKRAAQTLIQADPGENRSANFEFIPTASGHLSGSVSLQEDNLITDNHRYFTLNIPAEIRVLIVSQTRAESRFLLKALQAGKGSLIAPHFAEPHLLPTLELDNYDVIILMDIEKLNASQAALLQSYLARGKGIALLLGDRSQPQTFNEFWHRKFNFPRWINTRQAEGQAYLSLGEIQREHPIFGSLWQPGQYLKNPPKFYKIPAFSTTPDQKKLMYFSDNTPMLIQFESGQGRATLLATSPQQGWTDLHISGLFPPLMQRLTLYLAGQAEKSTSYTVGDTVRFTDIKSSQRHQLEILTPRGDPYLPLWNPQKSQHQFLNTTEPGIYQVFLKGSRVRRFAVNISSREAHGEFMDPGKLKELTAEYPDKSTVITGDNQRSAAIRVNRQLGGLFILITLCLAAAETFIGRINRNPSAVSPKMEQIK